MADTQGVGELWLQIGHGSRRHLDRCNSAPLATFPKAPWVSREPSRQGARLGSKPVWTPASLRQGLEPSDQSFVFAKPPYLFAEPPKSQLFQLKQSLLLDDDSITEAPPPNLGCTELEHELLVGDEEQRPQSVRPEMPVRLRRKDMAPRSRARYPPGFLHAARHDGLHRVKRAEHLNDVKFSIGSLTYFSVETCSEWQMPRRSEYRSPKSRRPLEGFGGRVKPGVYRQPEAAPAVNDQSEMASGSKHLRGTDIATTSPGSPCTPFRYACFRDGP
mmetsp:Transcript_110321/g.154833  ORF Transcript_110321/g.154833 Transcript_110321/m.154833 type:complete len:274 (-) Transcript_110321:10-831(-)